MMLVELRNWIFEIISNGNTVNTILYGLSSLEFVSCINLVH